MTPRTIKQLKFNIEQVGDNIPKNKEEEGGMWKERLTHELV